MKAFHPVQEQETIVLLQGFRKSPGEFVSHFKRYDVQQLARLSDITIASKQIFRGDDFCDHVWPDDYICGSSIRSPR